MLGNQVVQGELLVGLGLCDRGSTRGQAQVHEIFSIRESDVDRAKAIVLGKPRLSARDAIHVAVMEREGVRRIFTFDTGFDAMPGIERISA